MLQTTLKIVVSKYPGPPVRETNGFWVFAFAIFAEFSAQRKPNLSGFPLNCAAKFGNQRSAESATKLCALCRPKIAIFAEEKKTPCFFFFEKFRVFTKASCFFGKFATLPLGMIVRVFETGRFADDYAIILVLKSKYAVKSLPNSVWNPCDTVDVTSWCHKNFAPSLRFCDIKTD